MPRSLTAGVVLCLAAIAGCSSAAPTGEVESTSPEPEASPPSLTATPSPTLSQPSATASPSATAMAEADLTMDWVIPFTMTVPGDWAQSESTTENGMDIVDGTGLRYVLNVFRKSPDAPEVWIERLTTAEPLEATEPEPVEIGGAPGHVFDVQLRDGTEGPCVVGGGHVSQAPCYVIHGPEEDWAWWLEDGRPSRMWVLDVNGDTVVMYSDSSEDRYEAWVAVIEEIVATIRWPEP